MKKSRNLVVKPAKNCYTEFAMCTFPLFKVLVVLVVVEQRKNCMYLALPPHLKVLAAADSLFRKKHFSREKREKIIPTNTCFDKSVKNPVRSFFQQNACFLQRNSHEMKKTTCKKSSTLALQCTAKLFKFRFEVL